MLLVHWLSKAGLAKGTANYNSIRKKTRSSREKLAALENANTGGFTEVLKMHIEPKLTRNRTA